MNVPAIALLHVLTMRFPRECGGCQSYAKEIDQSRTINNNNNYYYY